MSNENRTEGMRPEMAAPYKAPTLNPEQVAEIAHEANRAYCIAIGDDSQKPWDEAEDWQRDSAVAGVLFHIANPWATPEMSHESRLDVKREQGWKYGAVKDAEKREHPCFTDYRFLPVEQRAKNHIFQGVVRACLKV